jgi:hypothetical protein
VNLRPAAAEIMEIGLRSREKKRNRDGLRRAGTKEGGKLGYLKRKRHKMLWLISVHEQTSFFFSIHLCTYYIVT